MVLRLVRLLTAIREVVHTVSRRDSVHTNTMLGPFCCKTHGQVGHRGLRRIVENLVEYEGGQINVYMRRRS